MPGKSHCFYNHESDLLYHLLDQVPRQAYSNQHLTQNFPPPEIEFPDIIFVIQSEDSVALPHQLQLQNHKRLFL